MFTSSRLMDTKLGMLSTAPMDREHDLARIIIDIDDDFGDQSAQELLAGAHRNARGIPRRR